MIVRIRYILISEVKWTRLHDFVLLSSATQGRSTNFNWQIFFLMLMWWVSPHFYVPLSQKLVHLWVITYIFDLPGVSEFLVVTWITRSRVLYFSEATWNNVLRSCLNKRCLLLKGYRLVNPRKVRFHLSHFKQHWIFYSIFCQCKL